jgi:mRNA interferase HicA
VKRRQLLDYLKAQGVVLRREGSKHSIYQAPSGETTAVPRHTEIADNLARKICKDLGIPPP